MVNLNSQEDWSCNQTARKSASVKKVGAQCSHFFYLNCNNYYSYKQYYKCFETIQYVVHVTGVKFRTKSLVCSWKKVSSPNVPCIYELIIYRSLGENFEAFKIQKCVLKLIKIKDKNIM
jgi:hypothetical protein